MNALRRTVLKYALGTSSGLGIFSSRAWPQDLAYPDKPIRMIVPGLPGGGLDIVVRLLSAKLTEAWGQGIVIENRAGSSGIAATELAAKARPDGFTLFAGYTATHAVNSSLFKHLPYDPIKDFSPIALLVSTPLVLLVHPGVQARTVKELIDLAKQRPEPMAFASNGNGTASHLAGELLKSRTGVKFLHVPYKGSAQALADLLSGNVSILFDNLVSSLPQVQSGRLRALAVTDRTRSQLLPNVPTMIEGGVADFEATNWYGILAPAGTPQPIIAKWNRELLRILQLPDIRAKLIGLGADIKGSTPGEFAQFIKDESSRYSLLIKESGAAVD